jgi:hypothetical protein
MLRRRVVYSNVGTGMFSIVKAVLSALMDCEEQGYEPYVRVANSVFNSDGYRGDGWTRFWEPIGDHNGFFDSVVAISNHPRFPRNDNYHHLRKPAHATWNRWIRPNSETLTTVQRARSKVPRTFPRIGVHFRATDKYKETTPVLVSDYARCVNRIVADTRASGFFLATDSAVALQEFIASCPGCAFADVSRAPVLTHPKGIHFTEPDKFKAGSEAIADVYALSDCDYIICGPSNLSECVTYLNPGITLVSMR